MTDFLSQDEVAQESEKAPDMEWPGGYESLYGIVHTMGTDWVYRALEQIKEELSHG